MRYSIPQGRFDVTINPGRFDRAVGLDQSPDDHRAMADREALNGLMRP